MMDEYSDSRAIKIQRSFRKNEKEYLNKLEEDAKVELLRQRFEASKGRKTTWEKIKAFIHKILFTRIA